MESYDYTHHFYVLKNTVTNHGRQSI
uniref:Uncharacterized protein n=1 Tax=Arundo donax TaxID=35708 RepID=A0A0A9FZK3_ARUDO